MTSHWRALSVRLMKLLCWAANVYSTFSPRSCATSWAILFSKPCPARFENGRSFGSAQTRSAVADAASGARATSIASLTALSVRRRITADRLMRKREHHERAAAAGIGRKIPDSTDKAACAMPDARIDLRIGDGAGPAADAVQNGDVLVAVTALIGDRLADESARGMKPVQQLAVARIDNLEPAVERAVHGDVARGDHGAGPYRKLLVDRPDLLVCAYIPGRKLTAVAAGAGIHVLGRAGDNLWTTTIFARDAATGEAVWADVLNPHDLYDFDEVNENILLDLPIDGQTRPVLVHPGRDGFMFVIDRRTGQIYSADKYDDQTSMERFDLKTGRPVMNEAQKPLLGKNISGICPASPGVKDWQPTAYSPLTHLLYIPHQHLCMDFKTSEVGYIAGTPYVGDITDLTGLEVHAQVLVRDV